MGGVEDRKESQQVGNVVEGHAVDADVVVLVVAALNVYARVELPICLYAGQRLHVVYGVGVS